MTAAKWSVGIFIFFVVVWLSAPSIFRAMKKKDFDAMYHNIQDAKKSVGAFTDDMPKKQFRSYEERYVRGEL